MCIRASPCVHIGDGKLESIVPFMRFMCVWPIGPGGAGHLLENPGPRTQDPGCLAFGKGAQGLKDISLN